MKKIIFLLACTVFFASCTKTEMRKAKQECPQGMMGDDCEIEIRTELHGLWSATDSAHVNDEILSFHPSITENSSLAYKIMLTDFAGFEQSLITAEISEQYIEIPYQKLEGNTYVQGIGTLEKIGSAYTIYWEYSLFKPSGEQEYSGLWIK